VAGGRKVGARALFCALLRHGRALSLGARHLACGHGVGAATCVVVDAIDRARKFNGGLPEQCSQALIGMSPINNR